MTSKRNSKVHSSSSLWKGAAAGLIAGLVASWIKSKAEPPLQKLGEELFPPTAAQKRLRGADTTGHPLNMPPAVLTKEVYEKAAGQAPDTQTVEQSMMTIHYAFGTSLGIIYGMIAEALPAVTNGAGIPAGTVMWALTHGSSVPALGIQAPVKKMPAAWYVWELGSHLVFGLAVEAIRRTVRDQIDDLQ